MRVDSNGYFWLENNNHLDDFLLEGGGGKGSFGRGSAYYNYLVKSRTSAYDANLGGYYYGGSGSIGGYTAQFAIGNVTVTDSMATDGGNQASEKNARASNVHGNSLQSTKTNYGYALVDSKGNILKFGETINPATRYSKAYLEKHDATMKILDSGSKIDIHLWQHDMNEYYYYKYNIYPPLNKGGW